MYNLICFAGWSPHRQTFKFKCFNPTLDCLSWVTPIAAFYVVLSVLYMLQPYTISCSCAALPDRGRFRRRLGIPVWLCPDWGFRLGSVGATKSPNERKIDLKHRLFRKAVVNRPLEVQHHQRKFYPVRFVWYFQALCCNPAVRCRVGTRRPEVRSGVPQVWQVRRGCRQELHARWGVRAHWHNTVQNVQVRMYLLYILVFRYCYSYLLANNHPSATSIQWPIKCDV